MGDGCNKGIGRGEDVSFISAARNLVLYTRHEGVVMEEEAPEDFTLKQIHTARRMMDNTNHKPSLWERIKERLGLRR